MQALQDGPRALVAQPAIPQVQMAQGAGDKQAAKQLSSIEVDVAIAQDQAGQRIVVLQGLAQMLQATAVLENAAD